jgi:uncharacterized membrane protein
MHSLLENYLAEVAACLSALPAARRNEELREMRAHLESVFAAYRQQGQTADEAARNAVAQFGTPETVGRDTVTAWRRGESLSKRNLWGAAACTLAVQLLAPLLLVPLEAAYLHLTSPGHFVGPSVWVLLGFNTAGPILAGAMSGLLFPKRAVVGTGFGLVAYFCLTLVLAGYWLTHHGHVMYSIPPASTLVLSLTVQSVTGGIVSLLSAWAVSRWRTAWAGGSRMARS